MNRFPAILLLVAGIVLGGCAKKASEAEALRIDYEAQGWTFLENFGEPIEGALFRASMSTATGTLHAISSDGRNQTRKAYRDASFIYRAAAFQSPETGATYSMVFQKKREPAPSAEASRKN